jgi:hypothetical protein
MAEEVKFNIDTKKSVTKSVDKKVETKKETKPVVDKKERLPGERSVFVMFLLTIITLGLYPYIWYIRRSSEFSNLETAKKLSKFIAYLVLFLTIFFFVVSPISIEDGGEDYNPVSSYLEKFDYSVTDSLSINYVATPIWILLLIFSLFLMFRSRTIINQAWQKKGVNRKVSWIFTLFFNVFYLQYEINRTINNRENEKRTGPWVWFIIVLLLVILTLVGIFFLPEIE